MTSDLWIWGLALGGSLLVVGAYWWRFRRHLRHDQKRLSEARALGFDRPKGQYPHIDLERCIGCSSCVSVCPEGDVLGMVGGQAVVMNGMRCIGIALCEEACPVGAIEVGLGEIKGRADLPLLDDSLQTSVPGLYIVGELAGLSLVRHAIAQGREVVHQLAAARDQMRGEKLDALDAIIVGSGPAGMSAALTAYELGLSYVVLEQEASLGGTILHYPRRKLVHTQPVELPVHGWLRQPEMSREELLDLFQGLVDEHSLRIDFGCHVTAVAWQEDGFEVETAAGSRYRGRAVILAMGRRGTPRKLGVPGEELSKVLYQVRDAEEFQEQRILCVGGGDSAVEAAMGLARQPGNEVTLSYRRASFGRIKSRNQERLDAAIAADEVRVLAPSQLLRIAEDDVLLQVGEEEMRVPNDYVFVLAGGVPPYDMMRRMGIRFGDDLEAGAVGVAL